MTELTLTPDDPAHPLFKELQERRGLNPITRADKTFQLFMTLHRTSSEARPRLNGNSRNFIIKTLGISKSLLSQYLSIHNNITSQKVKDLMLQTALGVHPSYLVSLVRGKNAAETELLQLAKVHELTDNRRITKHHIQMGVKRTTQ